MLTDVSPARSHAFALLAFALTACSSNGLTHDRNSSREERAALSGDAGTTNPCRIVDDRVVCDDDPEGTSARVYDCTWEWADDPCLDAEQDPAQAPPPQAQQHSKQRYAPAPKFD